MEKVGIVIVTYNRLEKLQKAVDACEGQTVPPAYIIIVDNASTDGTATYLDRWSNQPKQPGCRRDIQRHVLTLTENRGGSGGFYEGLKMARAQQAEWIFVSDDDAYPTANTLEILLNFADRYRGSCQKKGQICRMPAALCTSVICQGQYDTWHRRRLIRYSPFFLKEERIPEEEYLREFFCLDLYSYVGCLINRASLEKAGLPCKDYFISYDDSEHSLRIRRTGRIICVPQAIVIHDTESETEESPLSWKKYYTIRNKLLTYRKHFPGYYFCILCLYYGFRYLIAGQAERRLAATAIWDAVCGRTGLHARYRPGWKC